MKTMPAAIRGAIPLIACAMALAACSSSTAHRASGTKATTTTTSTGTGVTGAGTTGPSAPGTAGGGSSSGSSGSASTTSCTASTLSGTVSGTQGGAGVIELTLALRNASGSACTLSGYAGLQLIGAGGAQLATTVHQGGPLAFESVTPTDVTIPSGQDAYVNIGWSDVPTGPSSGCPTASALQVVPPGDSGHVVVSVNIQPCGGALTESAIFGSTSPATQTTAPPTSG